MLFERKGCCVRRSSALQLLSARFILMWKLFYFVFLIIAALPKLNSIFVFWRTVVLINFVCLCLVWARSHLANCSFNSVTFKIPKITSFSTCIHVLFVELYMCWKFIYLWCFRFSLPFKTRAYYVCFDQYYDDEKLKRLRATNFNQPISIPREMKNIYKSNVSIQFERLTDSTKLQYVVYNKNNQK